MIEAMKPITDAWGLLFRALGPSECFGLKGFFSRWLLRIAGLPLVFAIIIVIVWAVDRRLNGFVKAKTRAKSHAFLAVFFCYPTISVISIAPFICKRLGPTSTLLEVDDSVWCEDSAHRSLQVASMFVVILASIGIPLVFGIFLVRAGRQYEKKFKLQYADVNKMVAKDLNEPITLVEWVIRDVTVGSDYS